MLRDLHIRNLAVVAEANIELGPGFNVLSGETGAGKSILVDSLSLLAGVRANTSLIRTGADALTVTGVFDPSDERWRLRLRTIGLEADGDALIVRREIAAGGRSRVFVNDQPVTLGLLADLVRPLLRIHGQRDELGLVAPELQRAWLDRCGGQRGAKLRAEVAAAFEMLVAARDNLARLTTDNRAREERIDFLRYQLGEIEDAGLESGEEITLRRDREILRHGEAIKSAFEGAADQLYEREDAAYELLEDSRRHLDQVSQWVPDAADWSAELEELRIRTGELGATIRARLDGLDHEPGRLDEVETRLAMVERLMRKHGDTTVAVLTRRKALTVELDELQGDAGTLDGLRAAAAEALDTYRAAATRLSKARASWATKLARGVLEECRDLALAKARFEVELTPRRRVDSPLVIDGEAVEHNAHGFDHVVYKFSPNPGETLRSLAKVASGGELSRLYLAVQLAAGRDAKVSRGAAKGPEADASLVFDEVDAGVGGAEAAALGDKLKRLAASGQIIAVTHLAQVASYGDRHFKIEKTVHGGRTHTGVTPLDSEARTHEIARMMAGSEITELSLSHARELIAETAK